MTIKKHKNGPVTLSQLQRLINLNYIDKMSYPTLIKYIAVMEAEGKLKTKWVGSSKVVTLSNG